MITLQQLIYFRELALNGHLTSTAEKLYITQATLSNTIITLEKQLGVKLFDRVGRNLRLSEVGAKYLDYVVEALGALENGKNMIESHIRDEEQEVSVAFNNSSVWVDMIRDFQSRNRSYSIRQIDCNDSVQSRKMLINMEIDYVIAGTTDFSLASLEYRVFRSETICVCVPSNHRLKDRKSVTLEDIKDEPFICQGSGRPFQKFCDDIFKKAGIHYNKALECDYVMSSQLVDAGFGVRLSTYSSFTAKSGLINHNNICIPIIDDYKLRDIALIWHPRRYFSRAALDFREHVLSRGNAPAIIEK